MRCWRWLFGNKALVVRTVAKTDLVMLKWEHQKRLELAARHRQRAIARVQPSDCLSG